MEDNCPRRSERLVTKSERKISIKHDAAKSRFYVDDLAQAYLEYKQDGATINLLHTEVPTEMQGRGLGKLLAKAALEYVASKDLRLEIGCDFIRHFINTYEPQYLKYMQKAASL